MTTSSVQLAFYKGRTHWFDRLVQWWTKSPYSHCEVILEDHHVNYDDIARCASSSWPDGGVRFKLLRLKSDSWEIVTLKEGDLTSATNWFYSHRGEAYDLLSILGLVVRPVGHSTKRWNCVEACGAALGFHDTWRMTVADLYALCKR